MTNELNLRGFLEDNGGLEEYVRALLDGAMARESIPDFQEWPAGWIWWDLEASSEDDDVEEPEGYSLYKLSELSRRWEKLVMEAEEEGRPVVPGMPLMDDLGLSVMLAELEKGE